MQVPELRDMHVAQATLDLQLAVFQRKSFLYSQYETGSEAVEDFPRP